MFTAKQIKLVHCKHLKKNNEIFSSKNDLAHRKGVQQNTLFKINYNRPYSNFHHIFSPFFHHPLAQRFVDMNPKEKSNKNKFLGFIF